MCDMKQAFTVIEIQSRGRGLTEFTRELREFVNSSCIRDGLLTVFCRHTSASLVIQENADPDVRRDLDAFFGRLVEDGDPSFTHRQEGPDDMSAHIRCALTQTSIGIPLAAGRLSLGAWQGIYLWEHRTHAHRREVALHLIGE